MALSQQLSGTWAPSSTLGTYNTIFTATTLLALQRFWLDMTNAPAGCLINLSFQMILLSGGSYQEFANRSLSNAIAIPTAPSIGYEPLKKFEWEDDIYGYQVQGTVISGTVPTTALNWSLSGVS